jgi:hypothetical protein
MTTIRKTDAFKRESTDASPTATHKGQAHFADHSTNNTCGECAFLTPRDEKSNSKYCGKAAEMLGKWSLPVPGSARACKYFEPKKNKPSRGYPL